MTKVIYLKILSILDKQAEWNLEQHILKNSPCVWLKGCFSGFFVYYIIFIYYSIIFHYVKDLSLRKFTITIPALTRTRAARFCTDNTCSFNNNAENATPNTGIEKL